jgi:hypothetical protein
MRPSVDASPAVGPLDLDSGVTIGASHDALRREIDEGCPSGGPPFVEEVVRAPGPSWR